MTSPLGWNSRVDPLLVFFITNLQWPPHIPLNVAPADLFGF